jgi:hypothetical protein
VREWGVTPIMLEATRKRLKSVSDHGLKSTLEGAGRGGSDKALLKAIGKARRTRGVNTL